MTTVQSQSTSNACSVSQAAAQAALDGDQTVVHEMITGILERLGLASDIELTEHLLQAADVVVVPGSAFGAPGYLRLSFACSLESLKEAVKRIEKAVSA